VKGVEAEKITALYIEGVWASLELRSAANPTTMIAQNKAGFNLVWAAFGSAFSTYQTAARALQEIFSCKRYSLAMPE
jgi:hypothetical protein